MKLHLLDPPPKTATCRVCLDPVPATEPNRLRPDSADHPSYICPPCATDLRIGSRP